MTGSWLSSTRTRLWKKHHGCARSLFSSCGWQKAFGGGGSVVLTSKSTPGLYPPLWSPSKLLQYVPPGTSPEDHPGIEANTQCSPDLSPERVPLGAKQGLWSLVPGSLPGALQASRTENTVTRARGGTSGDGGSPPLSQQCLGCPASHAMSAFLQNWVRKWILATQKQV